MNVRQTVEIREARSPEDLAAVSTLLVEYAAALEVDLCFQDFEGERTSLPGAYAAPGGGLWIAAGAGPVRGCVALRPLVGDCAELKRLYVRPTDRASGLGRALAVHALEAARRMGYARVRLDTLPSMARAIAMYRAMGFVEIANYNDNPVPGVLFFELALRCLSPAR